MSTKTLTKTEECNECSRECSADDSAEDHETWTECKMCRECADQDFKQYDGDRRSIR